MKAVYFHTVIAGVLLSAVFAPAGAAEETAAPAPVYRASGDRAFAARSFDAAAGFYRAYRQEAEQRNDMAALRDAFESEINSLILGARAAQAEELLASYRLKFPDADPVSLSLWTADIMLLKHQLQDAEELLTKLLPELPKQDPRRIRCTMALAAAAEMRKDYKQAVAYYSGLLENSSDTPFMRLIEERRILALTALGNTAEAVELLAKLKLDEDERAIEAYRLLNIYLSLKNRAETGMFQNEKLIEELRTDSFFYLVTSLIGDEYTAIGNYESALAAYRLAYLYAKTSPDSFDAMTRMIDLFDKMDQAEQAGALAATQIDLFLRPDTSMPIKMAVIRLFAKTKREKDAVRLAEACLNTPGQDADTTFRTLFRMMTANRFLDAAEMLTDIYKSPTEAFKLKCKGDIQSLRGNQKEAAELYKKAAKAAMGTGDFADYAKTAVELYSSLKEYGEVIALTCELLDQNKHTLRTADETKLLFHRAAAYEALKQREKAKRDYLECEAQSVADSVLAMQAAFRAAVLCYQDKDLLAAEKIFERIFRSEDKLAPSAGYWLTLCADADDKRLEKRTQALTERFPASRFTGLALLSLANKYMDYGLQEKADGLLAEILTKHTALPEQIPAKARYYRALLAYQKKDYKTAQDFIKDDLAANAAAEYLAETFYLAGEIYRAESAFSAAAKAYRKAAELKSGSALAQAAAGSEGDCFFALASGSDRTEEYRTALAVYTKLLKQEDLLPGYAVMTGYKAGRCHQLLGETEKAAEYYRNIIFMYSAGELAAHPMERNWILKSINEFELIAVKSNDAGLINEAVNAVTQLKQPGWKERVKELKKLKRKIMTTGEEKK